jgi:hypothetical protein
LLEKEFALKEDPDNGMDVELEAMNESERIPGYDGDKRALAEARPSES